MTVTLLIRPKQAPGLLGYLVSDRMRPTPEFVQSILRYEPSSGVFHWKHRSDVPAWWNTKYADMEAGCLSDNGYVVIKINHKDYKAHVLAFVIMNGAWPTYEIDHRDTTKNNNAWNNLREATRSDNRANVPMYKGTASGLKGAYEQHGKFESYITVRGKRMYLGYFDTPEEAHAAYVKAANSHFKEFARTQ